MATSNIASMLNSKVRMSGLSSGLDTDSIIKSLLQADRSRVDKVKQQKQLSIWKRDNYRDITNTLRAFKDEYFDVLKPSNNFRSASSFASFSVSYGSSTDTSKVTATAGSGAVSKTHYLTIDTLATAAKISGTSPITAGVTGSNDITDFNMQGKQISVTLDGISKTISLEDYSGIADLESKLQASLNTAFGTGKFDVVTSGNKVELKTLLSGSTFSVAEATNTYITSLGFKDGQQNYVTGSEITATDFSSFNGNLKIKLNGVENTISIGGLSSTSTLNDVRNALQADINSKFPPGAINVSLDGNKLVFQNNAGQDMTLSSGDTSNILGTLGFGETTITGTSSADIDLSGNEKGKSITVNINGVNTDVAIDQDYSDLASLASYIQSKLTGVSVSTDATNKRLVFSGNAGEKIILKKGPENSLAQLGFKTTDNTSNKVAFTKNLDSIENSFAAGINFDANANVSFTINNVAINLNKKFSEATVNDVMNAINGSDAGVSLKYDSLNDKFTLTSKTTGVASTITYTDSDPADGILKAMGLTGVAVTPGTDAKFDLDGINDMVRSTNDFAIDGVSYSLKDVTGGSQISITVGADVDSLVTKIKGFVSKYNEVISKLNAEVSEKKERDYLPLTDDQKSAMSENDIKTWEDKAKAGLLNNDSIINSIVINARKALSDSVNGVTTSLAKMGITTGSYNMQGMLIVDDEKLKAAIVDNPEGVSQLFTQESQYSYDDALNDPAKRTTRYNESGLAQRLFDIIQDSIRTTRDSGGRKGTLLEKAGIAGDITEYSNVINSEINDRDKQINTLLSKITDKETALYKKFSAMESALSQMNSQSSWLSKQTGGQ